MREKKATSIKYFAVQKFRQHYYKNYIIQSFNLTKLLRLRTYNKQRISHMNVGDITSKTQLECTKKHLFDKKLNKPPVVFFF